MFGEGLSEGWVTIYTHRERIGIGNRSSITHRRKPRPGCQVRTGLRSASAVPDLERVALSFLRSVRCRRHVGYIRFRYNKDALPSILRAVPELRLLLCVRWADAIHRLRLASQLEVEIRLLLC